MSSIASSCDVTEDNLRRFATREKITPIVPQHGRRYVWICSQFHTRSVFLFVQIILIFVSISSLVCITGFLPAQCPSIPAAIHYIVFSLAIAVLISTLLAFAGMHYCDTVHRLGRRACKHPCPPALLLLPSYMAQVGLIVLLGIWTALRVLEKINVIHKNDIDGDVWIDIVMKTAVPLLVLWIAILYILVASFDFAFYSLRKSRYWRRRPPRPAVLTQHNYSIDFDAWSHRGSLKTTGSVYKSSFFSNHSDAGRKVLDGRCQVPRYRRDSLECDRLSAVSSRSAATTHNSQVPLNMGDAPGSLPTSIEVSQTMAECVQLLNAHVSPVKRQLETVYEESKSQTSGDISTLSL